MTKAYCDCHHLIVDYTQHYSICMMSGQAARFSKITDKSFKIYCKNCKTESTIDENSTGCPHCNSWGNLIYLKPNESIRFIADLKELYVKALADAKFEKEIEDIKATISKDIIAHKITKYTKSYGTSFNKAYLLLIADAFKNEGFSVEIEPCGNGTAISLSGWGLSDK